MFFAYNSIEFGEELKAIRTDLRLSQQQVVKLAKISVDTLRRIENGYVTPKIETLISLSCIYKTNLLKVFNETSKIPDLISMYKKVSIMIEKSNVAEIINVKSELININSQLHDKGLISFDEYKQFLIFCDASLLFIKRNTLDLIQSKKLAIDAMRITLPNFILDRISECNYNDFEVRILHLIAIIENVLKNHDTSINIINHLIQHNLARSIDSETTRNNCLLYFTLSYAYFEKKEYALSLQCSIHGINYAIESERFNELHLLYYRKGIAEYMLSQDGYSISFKRSINLLESTQNDKLAKLYKEITFRNYGIII